MPRVRNEGGRGALPVNSSRRNPCGDGPILCLDCIDASILVVIPNYHFARWYHWGKLGKDNAQAMSVLFLTTECSMVIDEEIYTIYLHLIYFS